MLAHNVAVIIPVYRGLEETRRCIEAMLRHNSSESAHLIIVDDASPEPEVSAYLEQVAKYDGVELLVNEQNLGFVATVNRGMAHAGSADVVLLNSDTEVTCGWLSRMQVCAYREENIGTVTPFSNNATVCSYPQFNRSNSLPEGWTLEALASAFAEANKAQYADIPTAVGFCMYIRRDCLQQVGLFDVENFGRGYGEESDFCMRAAKAGWRNVICADVFVFHEGGVSFSDETRERIIHAEEVMNRLHPEYRFEVARFVSEDPLRRYRDAVDDLRIARLNDDSNVVIFQLRTYRDSIIQSILEYKDFIDVEREQYQIMLAEARSEFKRTDEGLAQAQAIVDNYVLAIEAKDREIAKLNHSLEEARVEFKRTDEGLFEAQRIVREYAEALGQRDRAIEVMSQQMDQFIALNSQLSARNQILERRSLLVHLHRLTSKIKRMITRLVKSS